MTNTVQKTTELILFGPLPAVYTLDNSSEEEQEAGDTETDGGDTTTTGHDSTRCSHLSALVLTLTHFVVK